MTGYQVAPQWHGWVDEDSPVLVVLLYLPLSMLEPSRLGCNIFRPPASSPWARSRAYGAQTQIESERTRNASDAVQTRNPRGAV